MAHKRKIHRAKSNPVIEKVIQLKFDNNPSGLHRAMRTNNIVLKPGQRPVRALLYTFANNPARFKKIMQNVPYNKHMKNYTTNKVWIYKFDKILQNV